MAIENLLIDRMELKVSKRLSNNRLSHFPIDVRVDTDGYSIRASFFGRVNVGRDGSNDYKYVVDNFSITKTDDMPVTSPEEEVDSYTREISFHTDGQYPSRTAIHAGSAVKRRIKYVPSEQGIQEKVTALLALHGIDADELESSDVNIYYDSSDSSKVEVTFERPYKNGINAERYMIQGDIIRYSRGTLCSSSRFHVFEEMPFVLDAHELIGVIRNIKAVVSPKYN